MTKDRGSAATRARPLHKLAQPGAVEALSRGPGRTAYRDEVGTYGQRLGDAVRPRLEPHTQWKPPAPAVTEHASSTRGADGRGDHQDLADASEHQCGERELIIGLSRPAAVVLC